MIVKWDLEQNTAGFDFFSWLVQAKALGATEVVFRIEKIKRKQWSLDVMLKRFWSIVELGPALAGLPHRFGNDGCKPCEPHLGALVSFHRRGNTFPRLQSVRPPGKAEYTITLRRNPYIPQRNSNEEAWREFGKEIGARIIPDYDDEPIHLHERMALYAGAKMNFGVVNGPMHLCVLSEYPFMMFACSKAEKAFELSGIKCPNSYPWLLPNQFAFWEQDDLKNIRKRFQVWERSLSTS